MDRILAAQHMAAGDLLPATYQREALPADGGEQRGPGRLPCGGAL